LLSLSACVTHVPMAADYGGPNELPDSLDTVTPATAVLLAHDEERLRDRLRFDVTRVALPSNAPGGGSITFEYYDVVDAPGRTPVVVLPPILSGHLIVTRYFARYFANQGWRAVVLTRDRDPLEQLDDLEGTIRANLGDYRLVLDWLEQQPGVDPSRIGLFGISLGAMDAVMLAALDDRVDALVAAMAGGDLAHIVASTNYRRVTRSVDRWVDAAGRTREAMLDDLEERIATDPLALAPYVDAQRVLMIMTRSDAIVPFEAQQALRDSMGAPETLYLPTGHWSSVVYFPKLRNAAFEFFERQFSAELIAGR
jgi:dienelactone hydrolase